MKPDFAVTSLEVSPAIPVRGGMFTATVTVLNQGDVSGDAGVVRAWASKPGIAKAGDAGDVQQAAGMLAAGESRTFAFALRVPTRPGTHHARAFVDADDGTDEDNEGNNQKNTSYKPQDAGPQPLPAAVELRNLEQTYDGAEKTVAVATDPAGLAVAITYDGALQAPVGAGTYQVVATVVDEQYVGSASAALVVTKAPAIVTLGDLEQVYDGRPRGVTVTTDPVDLAVDVAYGGSTGAPVDAGTYAVVGALVDPNYEGSVSGTLVVAKAPAVVTLDQLVQVYDGAPKSVVVSTDPVGMAVEITYGVSGPADGQMRSRGSSQSPVAAGSYLVEAVAADENHEGSSAGTLEVLQASQTIDFPEVGERLVTDVVDLSATASSGLPVSFAVASGPARIDGATLAFTGTGEVAIVASQEGDDNWTAAPDVIQTLTAKKGPTFLIVSASAVNVREGGEGRFFVRLDQAPEGNVAVSVSPSAGHPSLGVKSGATRTFTPSNWGTWQVVTLAAAADENAVGETATFRISSPGAADQFVAATVLDDEIGANLALAASVSGATPLVKDGIHDVSTNYVATKWTSVPPGTFTMDLQTTATVSRIRLLNWDWGYRVHQYRILASVDGKVWTTVVDASAGEHRGWEDWAVANQAVRFVRFTGLSNSANSSVCIAELEVYGSGDPLPQLELSATAVNVREAGEGRFFVRLSAQPVANVNVSVDKLEGDASLDVQGSGVLTFKPSNWDVWQPMTLVAGADENTAGETAIFQVSAPGAADLTVEATALDDDIGANLALASVGTTIRGANALAIDGIHDVSTNYVSTKWTSVPPGTMTLDLQTVRTVSRIRLLNWDWGYRVHQYSIQASADGKIWTTVADASTGEYSGWNDWAVEIPAVRYLRFTGLSNSANSSVCIAEWEVYGPPPGRRSLLSATATAGAPAAAGFAVAENEPISVLTSAGPDDETGWNAVDGDDATAWVGQPGGGYVVVEYAPTLALSALELDMAEGSLTNFQVLVSTDAQNWQSLPDDLESNPISLNYLWIVFPDDGTAAVPHVLEIVPNP